MGGGVHTSKLLESFFFPSSAEMFRNTYETATVGPTTRLLQLQTISKSTRASITARFALRIPTPGQAGDTSLATRPWSDRSKIYETGGHESLASRCSFNTWTPALTVHIPGFVAGATVRAFSPDSPHMFGAKNALM